MIVGFGVLLAFLIGAVFLQVFFDIVLGVDEYMRLALIVMLSLLYLSFFACIGALISITLKHTSTSLVASLLLWFVIVVVQPNLHTYIASEFVNIPRLEDIQPSLAETRKPFTAEISRLQKDFESVLSDHSKRRYVVGTISYGDVTLYTHVLDADYEFLIYLMKQSEAYRLIAECAKEEWKLYQHLYKDRLADQLRWKNTLDFFSPAAILTRVTSLLARTDVDNYETLLEQGRQYWGQYIEYLDRKGVFSTNAQLFFSHFRREEIDPLATQLRFAQYAKDPASIPNPDNLPRPDLSDAPVLAMRETPIGKDLGHALAALFVLLFYCAAVLIWNSRKLQQFDLR